ncbi:Tonneau 1b [Musa troglodytarum]|uniref:Tonneau 1b n=1 Tax=Musa troglodytarum TaxID=320322 RepID=A0A9E7I001_9LILI|nr:Tonneau 1b [Musa troglodytarum]
MDDYAREMMDLKTLVTRTLEKKGVLAKIRPKDFWKEELKDFSNKNQYDSNKNGDSGPLLLEVLEGYLKIRGLNLTQNRMAGGSLINSETESISSGEARNVRRPFSSSSSSVAAHGGLPSLDRPVPLTQSSDRKSSSSVPTNRKDDYMWRYDAEISEDVMRAANALENIQLDRKARNLTTSWRHANNGIVEDDGTVDRR